MYPDVSNIMYPRVYLDVSQMYLKCSECLKSPKKIEHLMLYACIMIFLGIPTHLLPYNRKIMLQDVLSCLRRFRKIMLQDVLSSSDISDWYLVIFHVKIHLSLPRITELLEARNPSNPAVVSEIDGVVSFGKIKRGNREIIIESKFGEVKKYLVKLSSQILVQENDFVRAGVPLSDGAITPDDILRIQGPAAVQQYLVNEIQEVYRLQGVKINDKHFEVVIRQMMRKVRVQDPGDTLFLEDQLIHTKDFILENDKLYGMKVVEDAGDSDSLKPGQIITPRQLRDENSLLKRTDKNLVVARDVITATATPVLQGITRASLQTKSFISAASFQETTKVLNEAAVAGKVDYLEGLKENVIVGHRIPAGTGMREYDHTIVGSKEDYNEMMANKEEYIY